jgi:cell division protein FtsN
MAEYPQHYIKNLDATATKEAGPLIGMFLLAMAITVIVLYIIGMIINQIV